MDAKLLLVVVTAMVASAPFVGVAVGTAWTAVVADNHATSVQVGPEKPSAPEQAKTELILTLQQTTAALSELNESLDATNEALSEYEESMRKLSATLDHTP